MSIYNNNTPAAALAAAAPAPRKISPKAAARPIQALAVIKEQSTVIDPKEFTQQAAAARVKPLSEVKPKEAAFASDKHKMVFDLLLTRDEGERRNLLLNWDKNYSKDFPGFITDENFSTAVGLSVKDFLGFWINTDASMEGILADAVNLKDSYGHTPLHYVVMGHDVELASFLLKRGAKADIPSSMGTTAYTIAAMDKGSEMGQLLEAYQSKVGAGGEIFHVIPPSPKASAAAAKVKVVAPTIIQNLKTVQL